MNNINQTLGPISLRSLLVFGVSMMIVFLMVVIQHLGPLKSALVSPKLQTPTLLEDIQPKLEFRKNLFTLKGGEASLRPRLIAAANASQDYLNSAAFTVVDLNSGEVLEQKNFSKRLPIASLTKIMTAVVALDLADRDESFTVSQSSADQIPTKLGLIQGQKLTLEELLHGLMLVSANDAAQQIKEGIDQKYGGKVFIEAMNKKAKILGLKNTSFANPQGFDNKSNYSSVEDLAILTKYALENYQLIKEVVDKDYQFYPANLQHKQIDMYNWNGLLGVYPGSYGVKIGNTADAGYTTVVATSREGENLLAVLLGAPGVLERDLWTAQVLDEAFAKFGISPAGITTDRLKEKYSQWKYWY